MDKKIKNNKVLVLNGPNLNLLGTREPNIYGYETLDLIEYHLKDIASDHEVIIDFFQSNHEGELIDRTHSAIGQYNFIIINPAAFTHTSIAWRDAMLAANIPYIEVHLSNTEAREEFRHKSVFADKAIGVIKGLGSTGYYYALDYFISKYLDN